MALKTLPVRVMEGLIFTTFSQEPSIRRRRARRLCTSASPNACSWAEANMAHRELYSIKANWKLAVENYGGVL